MVIFRFRMPPLGCLLESPAKLYRSVPIHLDGALASAELLFDALSRGDTGAQLMKAIWDAEEGSIEEAPRCVNWDAWDTKTTGELPGWARYPRCSVLMPVVSWRMDVIETLLSIDPRYLMILRLYGGRAVVEDVRRGKPTADFHNVIPLRRRTNLERLIGFLSRDWTLRRLGQIDESRGPYKAIDSRAHLDGTFSTTTFVAILDAADEGTLGRCLDLLKIVGIGKKRDMGYGDLIGYKIYNLVSGSGSPIRTLEPHLLEWEERHRRLRVILRATPLDVVRRWPSEAGLSPLKLSTVMCSPRPPYWLWTLRRHCALPFSIFIGQP